MPSAPRPFRTRTKVFGRHDKVGQNFLREPKACRRIFDVITDLAAVSGNGAALGSVVAVRTALPDIGPRPHLVVDDRQPESGGRSGNEAGGCPVVRVMVGRRGDENQARAERPHGIAKAQQRGSARGITIASAVVTETSVGRAEPGKRAAKFGPAYGGEGGGRPALRAGVRGVAIGESDNRDAETAAGGGSDESTAAEGFIVGVGCNDQYALGAGPAQDVGRRNAAEQSGASSVWHRCAMLHAPSVFPRPAIWRSWRIASGSGPRLSMPLPPFRMQMWQTS